MGEPAPELAGVSTWVNTDPFTLESLRGRVVLIDFWTYTCVNCIRTFPHLREWHDKYAGKGLVIVGVHTPEFAFEHKTGNVRAAMERHRITWPVVQDNDYGTWQAFNNRFWPAKYLIDKEGTVRYTHFGEGAYVETEREIREALRETGADVSSIPVGTVEQSQVDPAASGRDISTRQTRELYAGARRNQLSTVPYIGHQRYYSTVGGETATYGDPGEHLNHFLYLHGVWKKGEESIIHGRRTEDLQDYIALRAFGTSVNAVLQLDEGEKPYDVVITLDGKPVPAGARGTDIQVDDEGRTYVDVGDSRMYNLAQLPEYGGHEYRLASKSDRFRLFAFTFGSYTEGP